MGSHIDTRKVSFGLGSFFMSFYIILISDPLFGSWDFLELLIFTRKYCLRCGLLLRFLWVALLRNRLPFNASSFLKNITSYFGKACLKNKISPWATFKCETLPLSNLCCLPIPHLEFSRETTGLDFPLPTCFHYIVKGSRLFSIMIVQAHWVKVYW